MTSDESYGDQIKPSKAGKTLPRCAHCRMSREQCRRAVENGRWHWHLFLPTVLEVWSDCPICEAYR